MASTISRILDMLDNNRGQIYSAFMMTWNH